MTKYQHATIQGHKIFYREAGSSMNPTIVLLHGFPLSSHQFRNLIGPLAERFHMFAPNCLGFGFSDAPAARTSITRSPASPHFAHIHHVNELFNLVAGGRSE